MTLLLIPTAWDCVKCSVPIHHIKMHRWFLSNTLALRHWLLNSQMKLHTPHVILHLAYNSSASYSDSERVCVHKKREMDTTPDCSRVVPHPSTRPAQCSLTSEFGWDLVHSAWYGRIRKYKHRRVSKDRLGMSTHTPNLKKKKKKYTPSLFLAHQLESVRNRSSVWYRGIY